MTTLTVTQALSSMNSMGAMAATPRMPDGAFAGDGDFIQVLMSQAGMSDAAMTGLETGSVNAQETFVSEEILGSMPGSMEIGEEFFPGCSLSGRLLMNALTNSGELTDGVKQNTKETRRDLESYQSVLAGVYAQQAAPNFVQPEQAQEAQQMVEAEGNDRETAQEPLAEVGRAETVKPDYYPVRVDTAEATQMQDDSGTESIYSGVGTSKTESETDIKERTYADNASEALKQFRRENVKAPVYVERAASQWVRGEADLYPEDGNVGNIPSTDMSYAVGGDKDADADLTASEKLAQEIMELVPSEFSEGLSPEIQQKLSELINKVARRIMGEEEITEEDIADLMLELMKKRDDSNPIWKSKDYDDLKIPGSLRERLEDNPALMAVLRMKKLQDERRIEYPVPRVPKPIMSDEDETYTQETDKAIEASAEGKIPQLVSIAVPEQENGRKEIPQSNSEQSVPTQLNDGFYQTEGLTASADTTEIKPISDDNDFSLQGEYSEKAEELTSDSLAGTAVEKPIASVQPESLYVAQSAEVPLLVRNGDVQTEKSELTVPELESDTIRVQSAAQPIAPITGEEKNYSGEDIQYGAQTFDFSKGESNIVKPQADSEGYIGFAEELSRFKQAVGEAVKILEEVVSTAYAKSVEPAPADSSAETSYRTMDNVVAADSAKVMTGTYEPDVAKAMTGTYVSESANAAESDMATSDKVSEGFRSYRSRETDEELEQLLSASGKKSTTSADAVKMPTELLQHIYSAENRTFILAEKIAGANAPVETQMAEAIKATLTQKEGETTFTMELNPKELGRVDVKVVAAAGKITVEIAAHSQRTAEILNQRMENLQAALHQDGVDLEKYQVIYSPEQTFAGQRDYNGSSKNPYSRRQQKDRDDDAPDFAQMLEVQEA